MSISKVVVKKNYPRDREIIRFFESKELYANTNCLLQWDKLEEEVYELEEALKYKSEEEILLEAGDVYITLLNVLHCKGLSIEEAVEAAANKVLKRQGEVINLSLIHI